MNFIQAAVTKVIKFLKTFRLKETTQISLPQLQRILYQLIKVDQEHLNKLLSQEPHLKSTIEAVQRSLQEHTTHQVLLLANQLTLEEEAQLFEKVSEEWRICQAIATKHGKTLAVLPNCFATH